MHGIRFGGGGGVNVRGSASLGNSSNPKDRNSKLTAFFNDGKNSAFKEKLIEKKGEGAEALNKYMAGVCQPKDKAYFLKGESKELRDSAKALEKILTSRTSQSIYVKVEECSEHIQTCLAPEGSNAAPDGAGARAVPDGAGARAPAATLHAEIQSARSRVSISDADPSPPQRLTERSSGGGRAAATSAPSPPQRGRSQPVRRGGPTSAQASATKPPATGIWSHFRFRGKAGGKPSTPVAKPSNGVAGIDDRSASSAGEDDLALNSRLDSRDSSRRASSGAPPPRRESPDASTAARISSGREDDLGGG